MIERYSLPEMAELFTDEARLGLWLEIELLAVEAWARTGAIPAEEAAACRARAPAVDRSFVERVAAREAVTGHDMAAFVDVVQEAIGHPAGSWVHHGLTSSDVVDTALSATLVRAADLLADAAGALVATLGRRALEHAGTAMVGRTHGMWAEPTTFGAKLALFALQISRDHERLRRARETVAVGKLSGAVGTYSNVDPRVEAGVCAALGLRPVPSTQVIARDRHAEYLYACASTASSIEALSVELRHLQRSEVGEVEEAFGAGQKGSSAMPHKRNPVTAERLSGLARVVRGHLLAGLEDIALWHERDISHSSVERIVLPDASGLVYYSLRRADRLVGDLSVDADRMGANLEGTLGLVFSEGVLLALVEAGLTRDKAYRLVQRDARRALEEGTPFRCVLEEDPELQAGLGGPEPTSRALARAFDLERSITGARRAVDAAVDAGRGGAGAGAGGGACGVG